MKISYSVIKQKFNGVLDFFFNLDYELFAIIVILVVVSRAILFIANVPANWLFSAILGVTMILITGAKITRIITRWLMSEDWKIYWALVPIVGTGVIYVVWMIVATFSSLAPIITICFTFIVSLFPPRLRIIFRIKDWLSNLYESNSNTDAKYLVSFITQIVLGIAVIITFGLADHGNWLNTIFDGIPLWIPFAIGAMVLITIYLALKGSKFWIPSLFIMSLVSHSFLLARGFIHFGGDDGDNMAVVSFLVNGGVAPFFDLSQGTWNWRFGSLASLCFQSNMAYIIALTGLEVSLAGGAMAIALSTLYFPIATFTLASALLTHKKDIRFTTVVLVLLLAPEFWWQLRFDPNTLAHLLLVSYIAVALIIPKTRKGLVIFLFSTFIIAVIHPTTSAVILAIIVSIVIANWRYLNLNRLLDRRFLFPLFFIIITALVFLLLIPGLLLAVLRGLSLSDIFISNTWSFGLYVTSSALFTQFFPHYFIIIPFTIVGFLLLIKMPTLEQFNPRIKSYLLIFGVLFFEVLILDWFLKTSLIPAWRLWPLVLGILMIPIVPVLLNFFNSCLLRITNARLVSNQIKKIAIPVIFTTIISFSLVASSYPTEQALNLDTTTIEEYQLIQELLNTIDVNRSIIITEFSTWRHIMGIMGDWPPSSPTYYDRNESYPALWSNSFGMERVNAFDGLAYYGNPTDVVSLLSEEGVDAVYMVVFNRYAGPKSISWYGGRPYIEGLKTWTKVILDRPAGYVLKFSQEGLKLKNINLSQWNITSQGVSDFGYTFQDDIMTIWANFTNYMQSVTLSQTVPQINCSEYHNLLIRYKSNYSTRIPFLRILLTFANNDTLELLPSPTPQTATTSAIYDLTTINQTNLVEIQLQFTTGNQWVEWTGANRYEFQIYTLQLATWWSVTVPGSGD